MTKRQGRYYLGRIHKVGVLTNEKVLDAIQHPVVIQRGKYNWTIVGVQTGEINKSKYLYGELTKYDDDGEVAIVDENNKTEQTLTAPGLIVDKSPFVFFEGFSGFAYLHVWNSIPEDVFRRRMAELITAKYDNFFVSCEIGPISDMREFTAKVSEIRRVTEIKAKVFPPNPLFGACWENLKRYLFDRGTQVLNVKEEGDKDLMGLRTNIQSVVEKVASGQSLIDVTPLPLVDAAVLMATDGYGRGKVTGIDSSGSQIVVCTTETQKSFLFAKDPDHHQLALETYRQHTTIITERNMRHA